MGFFSRDIRTMDELFVHTLRDIYYAEQRILQALPAMIEDSANTQLRSAFEHHMAETQNHVRRVEQVFDWYDAERKAVNCPAIDGILKEAKEVAGDVPAEDESVLDAALIAAAQAVEHYEIARYGALIAWARALGRDDCANILRENLAEEKAADKKLTEIAESAVNAQASAA
jgi:ferritin-like metal-binding protein YciE